MLLCVCVDRRVACVRACIAGICVKVLVSI